MTLYRVWRTDRTYRLIRATDEEHALKRVKGAVKATPVPNILRKETTA